VAIADRIASALALAREREGLAQRGDAFAALVRFSSAISRLDAADVYGRVVSAVADVIPADLVTLTVLDRPTGRYLIGGARVGEGDGAHLLGIEIEVGEGMAGEALRTRAIARSRNFGRDSFPSRLRVVGPADVYADAIGVPLLRDDEAVGALTLGRIDADRPFTSLELEALGLLAGQTALAISNAFLHEEVAALAVRDGLTGLYNRRHFDAAFEQLLATYRRHRAADGPSIAVILLDLDHFGQFNKRHGHQVGDEVLRRFAGIVKSRVRAADLAARYGGEEFVIVLDGATREHAMAIAEEIRLGFKAGTTSGVGGELLHATVSAGVAELSAEAATREALLRAADVGLYMAKRAGRDRVVAA
jgi:diguanylate cyclase (GGDEF)-like protein